MCENIHYYLTLPLIEVPYDERIGYPVAMLGDIVLYCKHYRNFDDEKESWKRRQTRIDWEHIYFIMADRDLIPPSTFNKPIYACDEETIQRFDSLPFKNKVCIVKNSIYSERYASCRRLLKGCDKNCVGILTDIMNITGKRMYQYVEDFDYIQFLNDGA